MSTGRGVVAGSPMSASSIASKLPSSLRKMPQSLDVRAVAVKA
jgi:hypothetical protein